MKTKGELRRELLADAEYLESLDPFLAGMFHYRIKAIASRIRLYLQQQAHPEPCPHNKFEILTHEGGTFNVPWCRGCGAIRDGDKWYTPGSVCNPWGGKLFVQKERFSRFFDSMQKEKAAVDGTRDYHAVEFEDEQTNVVEQHPGPAARCAKCAELQKKHGPPADLRPPKPKSPVIDGRVLTIGRIVRYVRQTANPGDALRVVPAIVTRVHSITCVDLTAFLPELAPRACGMVAYDAVAQANTWHWPPKEPR